MRPLYSLEEVCPRTVSPPGLARPTRAMISSVKPSAMSSSSADWEAAAKGKTRSLGTDARDAAFRSDAAFGGQAESAAPVIATRMATRMGTAQRLISEEPRGPERGIAARPSPGAAAGPAGAAEPDGLGSTTGGALSGRP